MTAMTAPAPARAELPLPRRLWNIVRLHLANPFTLFGTPLIILGLILAVSWMIWWILRTALPADPESIADVSEGFQYSGGALWIFVYMMVVAIQVMNLTFPLALGFGSTRRDFLLGTGVTFAGASVLLAALYTLAAGIESWTGGWGLGGVLFRNFAFGIDVPWWAFAFHVFAMFVFFFAIGSVFGAIYVRWKARGLITFFSALTLLLIGAAALLTVTESWPAVGSIFIALGFSGTYAALLGLGVVAWFAAWAIIRRATPRS